MPFKKTYEIVSNIPLPIAWDEYEGFLCKKWMNLLSQDELQKKESVFQSFLENNPCLIPGAFGLVGRSGHFPFPGGVISQPPLQGLFKRVPDFLWLANDSMTLYPVFIEIEAPSKRWFLDNGKQTENFTQAHNQLAEWKQWFSRPNHQNLFSEVFQIPSSFMRGKAIRPLFVLIYGRRSEFEGKPLLNEKRSYLARDDEFFMTFDRLSPDYGSRNLLCTRMVNGTYSAISVPPTFTLGPSLAEWRSTIHNKEQAIQSNTYLSKERKDFLISRVAYWDKWGQADTRKGLINTTDKE